MVPPTSMTPRLPPAPAGCVEGGPVDFRPTSVSASVEGVCCRGSAGLMLLALLAPLLLLATAPPAGAVGSLCLPSPTAACIAGTVRSDAGVVPDVKLTVTGPDGTDQGRDRRRRQVEPLGHQGRRLQGHPRRRTPSRRGRGLRVQRGHRPGQVRHHGSGAHPGPHLGVRLLDEQVRRAAPELGQRPAPRAAARAGLDRALASSTARPGSRTSRTPSR